MELLSVFIYAVKHIFMPGEATPVLVALGFVGAKRNVLVKMAAGLSLSNGGIMVAALVIGLYAHQRAATVLMSIAPYLRMSLVLVFFCMVIYFVYKGYKTSGASDNLVFENKLDLINNRPFITGLFVGLIPSTSDIGFIPIAPMLLHNRGLQDLWLTIMTVWGGVILSFISVAGIVSLLPMTYLTKKINRLEKTLYFFSAAILLALTLFLGYYIW